jgi:UTP--glucose-1-phosphate uridylyltransferase
MHLDVDPRTQEQLDAFGFDPELFARLRERLLAGRLGADANRVRGRIAPPAADDIRPLPARGSEAYQALAARGEAAMRAGEVGCVVLAGGMATRFGGVVKAGVEALAGRSFLSLKLADVRCAARAVGRPIPVFVMSSFATHQALLELVARETCEEAPVEVFPQLISLRLAPDGSLFRGTDGRPSPYAPGHGDLSFALRRSGVLQRFLAGGGRLLFTSNVDNLGASLDPAVIGAQLERGVEMTVEVGMRGPGELGGAPARLDGRLQIIEDFRFPAGFDLNGIPYFNTNTFVFDGKALDRDFPLTWFGVRKRVDGREAIQFEHLVGELTAFLSCAFLQVARDGDEGRFQPVKDPEELRLRRPSIERILRARGVLG